MKVIIAGSRSIVDYAAVEGSMQHAVKAWGRISQIVSGTARGVDRLGEQWAAAHGIPVKRFPADWNKYGKQAGYIRNVEMADYADACLVVWDGDSRGSMHMYRIAETKGLAVLLVVPSVGTVEAPAL